MNKDYEDVVWANAKASREGQQFKVGDQVAWRGHSESCLIVGSDKTGKYKLDFGHPDGILAHVDQSDLVSISDYTLINTSIAPRKSIYTTSQIEKGQVIKTLGRMFGKKKF